MIKIVKRGIDFLLPEVLALDSATGSMANDTLGITGAHGEFPVGRQSLKSGSMVLSGILKGVDEDNAQEQVDAVKKALLGDMFNLYRSESATRYVRCICEKIDHNFHRGSFGGSVASISATLKALDGFWIGQTNKITKAITGQPNTTAIPYAGSIAAPIKAKLTFSAGMTIQPGNFFSGAFVLKFLQAIPAASGHSLVVDTENRIVSLGGVSILNVIDPAFLLELGHIQPGENNSLSLVPGGVSGQLEIECTERFA